MNRKTMPLVLMLVAGAIVSIITFIKGYSIVNKLLALLIVLVLFYFLGSVLRWTLDYFDRQNEEKRKAEEAEAEAAAAAEAEAGENGEGVTQKEGEKEQ